jgi:hypothetical protein
VFLVLAAVNVGMLRDSLANGATWYRDYGLYGMQYGGRQVASGIRRSLERSPRSNVALSPTWANGTDVIMRFFLPDEDRVRFQTIDAYMLDRLPLDDEQLFVMTPEEYHRTMGDRKFTDIRVEKTVALPDRRPGFYFVRLRYSRQAGAIFAAQLRVRRRLVHEQLVVDGTVVRVEHSRYDRGQIKDLFDGDTFTLARTLEANPSVVLLTFPHARSMKGVAVTTGTMQPGVRVSVFRVVRTAPLVFTTRLPYSANPTVTVAFGKSVRAQAIEIRVLDLQTTGPSHVHIREIRLE